MPVLIPAAADALAPIDWVRVGGEEVHGYGEALLVVGVEVGSVTNAFWIGVGLTGA